MSAIRRYHEPMDGDGAEEGKLPRGTKRSDAARLLRPADLPDNFTRSLYKIAPYKGCAHGCRYCDGRAERYYVEGDFERDIELRHNIPARLAVELPNLRERGIISFGSGVTDSYQPLEGVNDITGRCAGLLAGSPRRFPAMVMTKSSLALRDLGSWKLVNERAGFILLVSLTSVDESLREMMEPGASSFASRLEMLRLFKDAGCVTGVLAMPLLPGLSDGEASIRALYAACADAGVDFIMPGGLTLRPGRQKDFYIKALKAYRPDLVEETIRIFGEERPSGMPHSMVARRLIEKVAAIRRDFPMPYLLPHAAFARMIPPHDALRLLFRDMVELYAERGIDTDGLAKSAGAYDAWLIGLRRAFRRKRSLPDSWLEERFGEAAADGELDRVLRNERLARFTSAVLRDGARLDYSSLKLDSIH
jgi:DNA repair photolyase